MRFAPQYEQKLFAFIIDGNNVGDLYMFQIMQCEGQIQHGRELDQDMRGFFK